MCLHPTQVSLAPKEPMPLHSWLHIAMHELRSWSASCTPLFSCRPSSGLNFGIRRWTYDSGPCFPRNGTKAVQDCRQGRSTLVWPRSDTLGRWWPGLPQNQQLRLGSIHLVYELDVPLHSIRMANDLSCPYWVPMGLGLSKAATRLTYHSRLRLICTLRGLALSCT